MYPYPWNWKETWERNIGRNMKLEEHECIWTNIDGILYCIFIFLLFPFSNNFFDIFRYQNNQGKFKKIYSACFSKRSSEKRALYTSNKFLCSNQDLIYSLFYFRFSHSFFTLFIIKFMVAIAGVLNSFFSTIKITFWRKSKLL